MSRGIARFKNVSNAAFTVIEIAGRTVQPGAEIDIMDDTLPVFYTDWTAVQYIMKTPGCSIYNGLKSGALVLLLFTPPIPSELFV